MKHAYVFPGQGAQAVGMGKDLYDNVPAAKELFEKANEILGFRITDIMFAGTDEELKQTQRHPARRIPPLGDHGQGAGREARCRRRTLSGRILGPRGRRSALVRGRSEARFEARHGHAGRLRGAARNDGRHSRSGRQGRRGDLRVGRRRGRRRQLQLPGPAGDLGSRGGRRRRLRESQGRRSAPCAAPAGGRSVPLAADGARQAGTRESHRRSAVPDARMPRFTRTSTPSPIPIPPPSRPT